jgi:hypothetical protein
MEGPMTEWEMPETRYAQSGDLSIAYQVLGDGPIDVVFVSGFISHQELRWEGALKLPVNRVADYARLITFDKRGTAVHIGARVAALAGAGEVLATSTVRDLVAGSGIEFTERGSHELKGVPGEWMILEALG